jgi:hypothetical protein
LIASSKYFNASIDEQEIRDRFHRFGGVPSQIFSNKNEYHIGFQKAALNWLCFKPAIDLACKDRSAIETDSGRLQKEKLFSFVLSDQDNGAYKNAYATLRSEYVYEAVVSMHKDELFTETMIGRRDFDTYLFKCYCRTLLYDSVNPTERKFNVKRKIGTRKSSTRKPSRKLLGGCSALKRVDDIMVSARTEELVLFAPYSTQYRLVDFVYRKNNIYYLFHATTGMEQDQELQQGRSADPIDISEWVVNEINTAMPSLLIDEQGKEGQSSVEAPKFEFIYVVPQFDFERVLLQTENTTIQARDIIKQKLGKRTAIYKQWNDIVSLSIAYYV